LSSTKENRSKELAGALFDELVLPLAAARKDAGTQSYFPLAGEKGVSSYYDEPLLRVMQPADLEFPGGGTAEGLVEALGAYWRAQGEIGLAAMAERLKELVEPVREEVVEGDGSISIFCYTMF
jgi:hypothetical protein